VNGDYGETYKVGLYLGHPELSTAKQLYMGKVKSGETLDVAFSHPVATDIVYIGIFDKDGRRIYMNAPIVNGHMDAVYGASDNASHRATEAEAPQYAKTLNDYLNPAGNTAQITVEEMKAYGTFTDADIDINATLTNAQKYVWNPEKNDNDIIWVADGKHFRVAKETTITKKFEVNATSGIYNDVVIYVEGKMHVNGNTLNGPTIVVADGGELIIDGNTSCTNAGRFIIMAGGKMTGTDGKLWDNSNGSYCYNAGTIKFNGIMNLNGTNFYNNGTVDVDVLTGTAGGTKFINFGKITANTNSYNSSAFNQTWVNGCYVHFKSGAGLGPSIMLSGSRFDIDGECRDATGTIEMHSQSQLKVGGKLFANNLTINGPTNNSEYAIVKIGGLATWGGGLQTNNRVFFDFDPNEVYDNNNPSNKHSEHNRNAVLGYIHYWVNEKNALNEITIPEGCGGTAGFNPDGNEGDEVIPEPESFSMRYCFEDNFPTPGDYDFNDVVLTVTPTLNDKTLTIKVSLDAVGGTETIAAAMRLVGVNSSDLVSYTVTKAFPSIDEMSWGATYHNIEHSDGFVKEGENPNNTNNMVIVLFKDAHWAINPENDNSGGPKRVFYNTVEPGDFYTNNVPPTTAIYTLVFNDEDKAKSMLAKNLYDVFIVEPYNGSYWEVHTVENGFKTLQVITPTKPEGYSQAYGDNMPWAIKVSGDFKYPYEWKAITNAYQTFGEWAKDSNNAKDWYEHPTSGLVFE
jgi:LruC domain-containing protein